MITYGPYGIFSGVFALGMQRVIVPADGGGSGGRVGGGGRGLMIAGAAAATYEAANPCLPYLLMRTVCAV